MQAKLDITHNNDNTRQTYQRNEVPQLADVKDRGQDSNNLNVSREVPAQGKTLKTGMQQETEACRNSHKWESQKVPVKHSTILVC